MKKTNLIYWITTILFGGFMLFSAIPDVVSSPEAVAFITLLGYPAYFIPFIGVAKVLGVIAIVVPGYPRIKEWAYAGLAYDLIAATYSMLAIGGEGIGGGMMFMLTLFLVGTVSYIYYHKRRRELLKPAV